MQLVMAEHSSARFSRALAVALVVHALVLLGIGFEWQMPTKRVQNSLEVTLATRSEPEKPEQADFVAQHNQQGSGEQEEKTRLSTTERADFSDSKINELAAQQPMPQPVPVEPVSQPTPVPEPAPQPVPVVAKPEPKPVPHDKQKTVATTKKTDTSSGTHNETKKQKPKPASTPSNSADGPSLTARSLEIASLEASLDMMRQEYAKRPRKRTLDSNSTQRSEDAFYLNAWKDKIQQVGNMHYPAASRQQGIYGKLRLLVVLRPDGSVKEMQILQSSGQKMLDDAAKQIVKLASPFAPFPPQMRADVDELEIIRTWVFERSRTLY